MGSHFTFKSFSTSKFSWSQTSIMGDLQRVLSQGEYAPLTCAPMFESNFIQVKNNSTKFDIDWIDYLHFHTLVGELSPPIFSLTILSLYSTLNAMPTSTQEGIYSIFPLSCMFPNLPSHANITCYLSFSYWDVYTTPCNQPVIPTSITHTLNF